MSKNLTKTEKVNLFKLKTRMVDVFGNFPSTNNKWCKLCFLSYEVQEHLMNCFVIRQKLKDRINFEFDYSDIEGSIALQEKFAKCYTIILTTREEILSVQSPNGAQLLDL